MKASLNHLRRRFPRLMAALLCTLLLGGCSQLLPDPVRSAQSTLVPGVDTVLPDAEPAEAATSLREVTLYFRYEDQPYLAPETRSLTVAPDEPFELALLRELAQGPSPSSVQLTSALPEGCLILSVAAQGRTLFVTLSNNILAGWSDEPATWEQDPYWQGEARCACRALWPPSLKTATMTVYRCWWSKRMCSAIACACARAGSWTVPETTCSLRL